MTAEPTTGAGRALLDPARPWLLAQPSEVFAIEAEAEANVRRRIAEAVRELPGDCHSEEGSCYCGSEINPDTPVSRAAVLDIIERQP